MTRKPIVALLALALTQAAFSLGIYKNTFALPAGVKNTVVRYGTGSGTVIAVKPIDKSDPKKGGYLCLLTADHVGGEWMGFGNGASPSGKEGEYKVVWTSPRLKNAKDKPEDPDTFVDIKMVGIKVDDLTKLPEMTFPSIGTLTENSELVQAGYGESAAADTLQRAYYPVNEYGTYRCGTNDQPTKSDTYTRNVYKFKAIRAPLYFKPNGAFGDNITFGSSYLLAGDSGGPSFQKMDDAFLLVGVHSGAQVFNDDAGQPYVPSGSIWADVRASEYSDWINQQCMAVPEPDSLLVFVGLLPLLRRRR